MALAIDDIGHERELRDWLGGLSIATDRKLCTSALFAARSALRILPVQISDPATEPSQALLHKFQALAIGYTAGTWPRLREGLYDAALYAAARATDFDDEFAADAARAASSVDTADATRAAAYAAAYAADSLKAAVGSEVELWKAIRADAIIVRDSEFLETVAYAPLWPHGSPEQLDRRWQYLSAWLLKRDGERWDVWTRWYNLVLSGKERSEGFELSRALIAGDRWAEGPSSVNPKIASLEFEFYPAIQEAETPQGVSIVFKEHAGRVGYQFQPPTPEEAYQNLIQKIADRVERVWQGHNRLVDALKDDVDEILTDIGRALDRYRDKPWRLHDDFATAVVNLSGLDGAEQELRIRNLLRDLQDGVSDLRELVPELREKTKARMAARIGLPDNDVLMAFEALIEALGDAGEADLVQELRDHLETLKTARAENPDDDGAPMEEGEVKDAAYAEGGLWIRVRNRANEVAASVGKGADGAVKTTEKTAKILDAAQKIGKHWQRIEPWIISWF